MVETILIDRDYWQLVAESTDETLFWRHKGNGLKYVISPTPGDDNDIARLQDTGDGGSGGGASALSDLTIDTHKDWQNYNISNLAGIGTGEVRYEDGRGPLSFPAHHTNYQAGLDKREIARYTCESGEFISVYRLETKLLGGGTDPDFAVELYDATNQEVLASTTDRLTATDGAIDNSGSGATVLLRVTNQTGTSQRASISGIAGYRST